jgi:hypothetical protein
MSWRDEYAVVGGADTERAAHRIAAELNRGQPGHISVIATLALIPPPRTTHKFVVLERRGSR